MHLLTTESMQNIYNTQIGLLSELLAIRELPKTDYAATEALIKADGGKHVRAKDGRWGDCKCV